MNAMQKKLAEMRAKHARLTSAPPIAKPSKLTLADVIARHRETKAEHKQATQGFNPEGDKIYSVQLLRTADVKELLKRARFNFPRLQVRNVTPFHVEIAGRAESRWFIHTFNEFIKP